MKPFERMAEYDNKLRKKHGPIIVGCDECGRGAWAGPLSAGAVILPADVELPGLNDSKLLTPEKREELAEKIKKVALGYGMAHVHAEVIDIKGVTWANKHAMKLAIEEAELMAQCKVDLYVVDQCNAFPFKPYVMMPKADSISLSVAAASVLGKTSRDSLMCELSKVYPGYGWEENKGYINEAHIESVKKLGLLKTVHRYSYQVKGFTKKPKQITIMDF